MTRKAAGRFSAAGDQHARPHREPMKYRDRPGIDEQLLTLRSYLSRDIRPLREALQEFGRRQAELARPVQELRGHIESATAPVRHIAERLRELQRRLAPAIAQVSEAFARYAGIRLGEGISQERFDEVMVDVIEPAISGNGPVFLYDYPAETGAALARLKQDDPCFVERFELYIQGIELCNGFSELTGAMNYQARFERAKQKLKKQADTDYPLPLSFLVAMADMPPAAGNALGIDRLAMLFCNADDIAEVIAFPPEDL